MRASVRPHGGHVGRKENNPTKLGGPCRLHAGTWPSGHNWQLHVLPESCLQCTDAWDLTCDKMSSEVIRVTPEMP